MVNAFNESNIENDRLYIKYKIERIDNYLYHANCDYFVLDCTHDPAARKAVLYYSRIIKKEQPGLAKDIRDRLLDYS